PFRHPGGPPREVAPRGTSPLPSTGHVTQRQPADNARQAGTVQPVRLVRDGFPGDPALEVAVGHALLRRVARGEIGPTLRVYRPGATVAFGRLDRLRPGFAAAVVAARAHGFEPVLRQP